MLGKEQAIRRGKAPAEVTGGGWARVAFLRGRGQVMPLRKGLGVMRGEQKLRKFVRFIKTGCKTMTVTVNPSRWPGREAVLVQRPEIHSQPRNLAVVNAPGSKGRVVHSLGSLLKNARHICASLYIHVLWRCAVSLLHRREELASSAAQQGQHSCQVSLELCPHAPPLVTRALLSNAGLASTQFLTARVMGAHGQRVYERGRPELVH